MLVSHLLGIYPILKLWCLCAKWHFHSPKHGVVGESGDSSQLFT